MAQKTALAVTALPGPLHSFLAKALEDISPLKGEDWSVEGRMYWTTKNTGIAHWDTNDERAHWTVRKF